MPLDTPGRSDGERLSCPPEQDYRERPLALIDKVSNSIRKLNVSHKALIDGCPLRDYLATRQQQFDQTARAAKSDPNKCRSDNKVVHLLNRHKQSGYSQLIRRAGLQLPALVHLLCGKAPLDARPNKALELPTAHSTWADYKYQTRWKNIVEHGVRPTWYKDFSPQAEPPANHGSAKRALNTNIKNLRAGQDSNCYLILDIDLLPMLEGVTCSPFGVVQKGEVDLAVDARIIHDLSNPLGSSINDNSVPEDDINLSYDGAEAISNRIIDVAEYFRSYTADFVGRVAGTIPGLGILVIDLCCPIGWKNFALIVLDSGAAINHLYANSAPGQPKDARGKFDAKAWCDDHIAVEPPDYRSLFGAVGVLEQAKKDLRWFGLILTIGRLNAIPLQRFTRRDEPSIEIFMDASDRGLCAMFPVQQKYLQVQFDTDELELIRDFNDHIANEFGINVRELMSAVFASLEWAHRWAV
ncbi:hypothetical protein ON010_g17509 [Phytophthora cinnamomi]|nr:hypothetical protein ON010_g17509 [Phytophthora cinnamomi]